MCLWELFYPLFVSFCNVLLQFLLTLVFVINCWHRTSQKCNFLKQKLFVKMFSISRHKVKSMGTFIISFTVMHVVHVLEYQPSIILTFFISLSVYTLSQFKGSTCDFDDLGFPHILNRRRAKKSTISSPNSKMVMTENPMYSPRIPPMSEKKLPIWNKQYYAHVC